MNELKLIDLIKLLNVACRPRPKFFYEVFKT